MSWINSKPSKEYLEHHNKENDGHEHGVKWSNWIQKTTKRHRTGYCEICWKNINEWETTHKLVPIIDLEVKKREDGKKRGRERKEQQKCNCTHYYYEHEKGKCTKCSCVK